MRLDRPIVLSSAALARPLRPRSPPKPVIIMRAMTASTSPDTAAATWDESVATLPGGHVLQTHAWGALKSAFGWQAEEIRTPGAAALVLFRPLPLRLGTLAYVPRGPAVDWDDAHAVQTLLQAVDAACRRRRAALLK